MLSKLSKQQINRVCPAGIVINDDVVFLFRTHAKSVLSKIMIYRWEMRNECKNQCR